jgi:hypothetical protein
VSVQKVVGERVSPTEVEKVRVLRGSTRGMMRVDEGLPCVTPLVLKLGVETTS